MRTYAIATGVVFALLVVAHVWRIVAESRELAREPWFIGVTLLSALLSGWAFYVARKAPRG